MGDAARKLPATQPVDPVRAELHMLIDRICDLVRAPVPAAPQAVGGVVPLGVACEAMRYSRRRLRTFCLTHGVAITGEGKRAAVDLDEVRRALASQPRVKHDAPSKARRSDAKRSFEGGM